MRQVRLPGYMLWQPMLVAYWGLLRGSESGRRENGIVARGPCQLCGIRQFFEHQILLRIKDKKLLFAGRNMAEEEFEFEIFVSIEHPTPLLDSC